MRSVKGIKDFEEIGSMNKFIVKRKMTIISHHQFHVQSEASKNNSVEQFPQLYKYDLISTLIATSHKSHHKIDW